MIEVRQARVLESVWPAEGLVEWVRSLLSSLSARFSSWKSEGSEDDSYCGADPELVAALEYIASLLDERPKG